MRQEVHAFDPENRKKNKGGHREERGEGRQKEKETRQQARATDGGILEGVTAVLEPTIQDGGVM